MAFRSMICVCCGNPIIHNASNIPACLNLLKLEIMSQLGQKTCHEGPNIWICHDCNYKIEMNIATNARMAFEEIPEPIHDTT
jgi:hypothetical protein